MAFALDEQRRSPVAMDLRGGAASEAPATLDVPLSSVINSSTGTHESPKILSASVSLVDNVEVSCNVLH